MRLIDADKLELKHYVQGGDVLLGYAGTIPLYRYVDVIKEDINNAPTVEAIPIEWLRKYVDEHDEIVEEGLYWIVEGIIDDWEKENETS